MSTLFQQPMTSTVPTCAQLADMHTGATLRDAVGNLWRKSYLGLWIAPLGKTTEPPLTDWAFARYLADPVARPAELCSDQRTTKTSAAGIGASV